MDAKQGATPVFSTLDHLMLLMSLLHRHEPLIEETAAEIRGLLERVAAEFVERKFGAFRLAVVQAVETFSAHESEWRSVRDVCARARWCSFP